MHENREISRTSCSKEQDRSAKAINRTADVNVQEKSDCAVVPVNQSNKEAQASAESGEGRAQTKENIVQSHKLPTQSGKGLSQGLRGGRQRPLGIAAPEDKIVQQAVVTVLNQIYEADFKGFSYGFRPGRSPHQALDALTVGLQRKRVNWVVDADIRGFFDNMSHEWTMQ